MKILKLFVRNLSYILTSHEFKENNEDDNKKDINKKQFPYKLKMYHSQNLTINSFLSKNERKSQNLINRDSLKLIDIYTKEYNFNVNYLNKLNKNKEKIYFNKNNTFEYIWHTPSYEYLVIIKTPEISFEIDGIEIRKNIDIELLLFLSKNKFKNWDFYLIQYLFSFYDFIFAIKDHFSLYRAKEQSLRKLIYNNDLRVI